MDRTPGVILPSSYSSQQDLKEDVQRRDAEAGFTPFNIEEFIHSNGGVENFIIEHHGVKGQKWGIRHRPQRKKSADFKTTEHLRKKRAHELSNKQLQKVNTRINLEQNFKKLNPTTVQKGQAHINSILGLGSSAGVALTVAALVKSPAGQLAIAQGKRFISSAALVLASHRL